MIFDLAKDFAAVLAAMPQDHPRRRILALLEEALRRDIHFIARHPTTLFQCLWNTCWWYDCPEAESHYELKDHGWKGPWNRLAGKLSELLEQWRGEKDSRIPDFLWLRYHRPTPTRPDPSLVAVLWGHEHYVTSVGYSLDGRHVVSTSPDKTIRVWDAISGRELRCLRWDGCHVINVAFSPDGETIVGGLEDHSVCLWDSRNGRELRRMMGHDRGLDIGVFTRAVFSPDGHRIVSGSEDKTLRIWDTHTGRQQNCIRGHKGPIYSVAFSPDGERVLSGSGTGPGEEEDNTARLWDAETGQELLCLYGHKQAVTSVAFSPTANLIASASRDGTVRVWEARTGGELLCLGKEDTVTEAIALAPNGRRIVGGCWDGTLCLWDLDTGELIRSFYGHRTTVVGVAFSPDGHRIASASLDQTLRIWDSETVASTEPILLRGHKGDITCIAFTADGQRVASGSRDRTVHLWDTQTGLEVGCLSGHATTVSRVGYSLRGELICALRIPGEYGEEEVRVVVWKAETGRVLCMPERVVDIENWLKMVDATEEKVASAAGSSGLRALSGQIETIVQTRQTGEVLAWWPSRLRHVAEHPSGRTWAAADYDYLAICTVEGRWEEGS